MIWLVIIPDLPRTEPVTVQILPPKIYEQARSDANDCRSVDQPRFGWRTMVN